MILEEPVVAYSVRDVVHNKLQIAVQIAAWMYYNPLEILVGSLKSWEKKKKKRGFQSSGFFFY